ncbi:MAG: DNA repair protein RecN [Armatimonadota bacterium]
MKQVQFLPMLQSLYIENLAIIDRLEIEFQHGLNVLTGETGAGKSILLDALGLVLGERANPTLVRAGADRLKVCAVFALPADFDTESFGVELEEGALYLSREVQANGRSLARINGQPVPIATLKAIGEQLVDLHGQHEHQSLLRTNQHLDLFDRWLGEPTLSLRNHVKQAVQHLHRLQQELQTLTLQERERAQMLDLYRFQLEEIRSAELKPDEEESLLTEERRLTHSEKLLSLAGSAYEWLMDERGAYDQIASASRNLTEICRIDPSMQDYQEQLEGALATVEEVAHALRRYTETVEYDPERLEQVIARLELIKRLKRKYGDTIPAILAYAQEVAQKLETLEHQSERRDMLEHAIAEAQSEAERLCTQLSERRRDGAQRLAQAVQQNLRDLAMERALFEIAITPKPMDTTGADAVEFLFSANPGESPRPLHKIASGGEISRVMLALKAVLADASPVPTLIFDEIDAGLGGRTAFYVGEKLAQLAQHFQILCVTHLAQIASRADCHFFIEKYVEKERTRVHIQRLTEEDRIKEIARMLAGEPTETALQHARELLQRQAQEVST